MHGIWTDARLGWRSLFRRPGFTAVSSITLALGIGAATAMFTIVNAILLTPLPYRAPERLGIVRIESTTGEEFPLPDADFLAWRARHPKFERVAVFAGTRFNLTGAGSPEVVSGAWVSGDFFAALGVQPEAGRLFHAADDAPGALAEVVLAHAFWRRRFAARQDAIGQTIRVNDVPCTVIGVAPPAVALPESNVALWRNLVVDTPPRRGPFYLTGIARVTESATFASAAAALDSVEADVKRRYGNSGNWSYRITPLKEAATGTLRRPLLILLGAVGVLLLIAVGNVTNLLLAQGTARERELAVRAALGAGRARLVRQLLTEAALLAGAGGTLGVVVAFGLTRVIAAAGSGEMPQLATVHVDARVLVFAVAVSCTAALLFGTGPAVHAAAHDVADPLRGGQRAGTSPSMKRALGLLVAIEMSLALLLSIGAGLFIRSLIRLQHVDIGIDNGGLLTFALAPPETRYRDASAIRSFYERLMQKMEEIPGVRAAAVGVSLPPGQLTVTDTFTPQGKTYAPGESAPVGPIVVASAGYFHALGIPLLRGRLFDRRDGPDSERVVIVSRALAERYYANGDAVGALFRTGGPERPTNPWMRIVGIVGDVRYDGLSNVPGPAYYLPFAQESWPREFVVVRAAVPPASIVAAVRSAVWSLDADLPLARLRTMDELIGEAAAEPRFRTVVLSGFGALGLLLAVIGVYGVMSYSVSQRMHEMGIRAALGAQRADLSGLILRDAAVLVGCGAVLGIVGALLLTRAAASLLYGVTPVDPLTFAAATVVLCSAGLVSAYVPARRASNTDPIVTLKTDV